jgi:hypothetical protein
MRKPEPVERLTAILKSLSGWEWRVRNTRSENTERSQPRTGTGCALARGGGAGPQYRPTNTLGKPPAQQFRRWAIACLTLALGFARSASADGYLPSRVPEPGTPPSWAEAGEPIPVEGTGWTPAIAELENAEAGVRRAWHNVETAQFLLTHAKIRRYPRGEPFLEIRDRVIFLEAERDKAELEFMALVERTRRGGMPAGTLSTFLDFSDEVRRERALRSAGS